MSNLEALRGALSRATDLLSYCRRGCYALRRQEPAPTARTTARMLLTSTRIVAELESMALQLQTVATNNEVQGVSDNERKHCS